MDVYLVEGSIEDGMQGVPFTLGIFSSEELARDAILNFIGNAKYTTNDNIGYSVEEYTGSCCYYYCINSTKYSLDKANTNQKCFSWR